MLGLWRMKLFNVESQRHLLLAESRAWKGLCYALYDIEKYILSPPFHLVIQQELQIDSHSIYRMACKYVYLEAGLNHTHFLKHSD